eukprot:TRINITY_DN9578_c0_g1_i1.p1 TRINITY_DN9578_c0_g1~~TRINITY_DN9578_c0_g1_i1.p1  ORF type:complete len:686 (+),score=209.32 TRINITY_DN9578_c0_g1_i1:167-2224(+)
MATKAVPNGKPLAAPGKALPVWGSDKRRPSTSSSSSSGSSSPSAKLPVLLPSGSVNNLRDGKMESPGTARRPASGQLTARGAPTPPQPQQPPPPQSQPPAPPPFAWRTILRDATARRCVQNILESRNPDSPAEQRAELSRLLYGAAIEQCLVELGQSCREGAPEAYIAHAWGDPIVEAKILQVEADLRLGGIPTYFEKEKKAGAQATSNKPEKVNHSDKIRAAERIIVFGSELLMKKFKAQIGVIAEELTPIISRFTADLKRADNSWPSVIPVLLDGAAQAALPQEFHDVVYTDLSVLTDPASYFKSLLYLLFSLYGDGYADAQDRIDRVRELWEVRSADVERRLAEVPEANLAAEIRLAADLFERCRPLKTNVDLEVFQQPPPVPNFTARPQHLGALRRAFPVLHQDRQTMCLLHGPAGSGKTQTAVVYSTRARSMLYSSVIWLQAQNEPKLLVQLTEVAKALEMSADVNLRDDKGLLSVGKDAIAMARSLPLAERLAETARNVSNHLSRYPGWLLVVDDVESAAAWASMQRHLPRCGGHILVTSRDSSLSAGIDFTVSMNPLELGSGFVGSVFGVPSAESGNVTARGVSRSASDSAAGSSRPALSNVRDLKGADGPAVFDPRLLASGDAQSLMTAAFSLMRLAHEKMVHEAVAAIVPGAAAPVLSTAALQSVPLSLWRVTKCQ